MNRQMCGQIPENYRYKIPLYYISPVPLVRFESQKNLPRGLYNLYLLRYTAVLAGPF